MKQQLYAIFIYSSCLLLLIGVFSVLRTRELGLWGYSSTTQRKVLLFAYYRSGSTLTGQLFNYNPSAFYWFEPLNAVTLPWGWVYDIIPPRNLYHFDNGTEKQRNDEMRKTLVQPLQAIFSCNMSAVDARVFTRGLITERWTINSSLSLKPFRECNWQRRREGKPTLDHCLEPLNEQCRQADIIAVKVIRLHMSYVDELLADDTDLRLIHLVRDPRGLVQAWRRVAPRRMRSRAQTELNAKLICQRMETDCRIRRQLERKYPRRILVLRYEDLVTATDTVLRDVYAQLLQLRLPSNIIDVITEQLHANSSNGATGTLRRNGTATATNWRRTMDDKLLAYVRTTCKQLLNELNYH